MQAQHSTTEGRCDGIGIPSSSRPFAVVKKTKNKQNKKTEPMKIIKNLTFAALAATLLFQTSITRAGETGNRDGHGQKSDHNNGAATVTWTKWTTWETPTPTVFAFLAGIVGGDVGDGTFTGEALIRTPLSDGVTVLIEADYHFHGSKHSFTAHLFIVQTNIIVNGAVINQVGVLTGVISDGWLKGNVVEGEYARFIVPHDGPNPFGFEGTLEIKKGSKDSD
jgi:hypothetical protein